ncbi:MAG: MBL fold metallo-hydrolase [Clostridia bacterium]|nr:MBL fold metallo-hydrolase [Clostridia bacterium]
MPKDFIHFFGTTGNKDIFFKKIRSSGGLYFSVDNTNIIIDPGPNTFYKYINTYENKIDGIILSHIHIDHSNDLNIFVELMTNGGEEKQGSLLLPNQAIEERVLFPYVKEFPEHLEIIKPNSNYTIKNIEITSSIEHKHGVENYGFKIKTKNYTIGLVTDTAYFPELLNSYIGCDILIVNVPYHIQDKPKPKHLDIVNVEEFIKVIKPNKVILTHFNCNILNSNPVCIADELSRKYSIEVISAEDDMILEL